MPTDTKYTLPPTERKLVLGFVLVGFAHLAVGILMGFLQGMSYSGMDLFKSLPFIKHYYQALSIHGVFNVLIFTTFFIAGFMILATSYGLRRPLHSGRLGWINFWLMVVGVLLVDWALLGNHASVLYTSYAPLQAHPAYYIGLALVVVGTWLLLLNMLKTYFAWRRENPGQRTPLVTFGALTTMIMWTLASVGVAVQFVGLLIPWSLGLLQGVDPLLSRTLFWMTGHPIVYFWLLPAYISWYFLLPRQNSGKLFSETLARLAFLLFIPLSLPVGFHHQYVDPGVSEGYKAMHGIITFAVFMPSMITAFTVVASMETGGRARGGSGRLGWIRTMNWGDPSVAAQLLAMGLFALGGITGLVNASFNMNLLVHNSLFIPGHFHLTVGTAVAMTFMGVAYWLVPYLTGRRLWSRKLALVQVWTWFVGMFIMSRGMSLSGIYDAPRRTFMAGATYGLPEWEMPFQWIAFGGVLLTISGVLFFTVLIMTIFKAPKAADDELAVPLAEPLHNEERMPVYLDRFAPWVLTAVVLVLIGYGPTLYHMFSNINLTVPGFKFF